MWTVVIYFQSNLFAWWRSWIFSILQSWVSRDPSEIILKCWLELIYLIKISSCFSNVFPYLIEHKMFWRLFVLLFPFSCCLQWPYQIFSVCLICMMLFIRVRKILNLRLFEDENGRAWSRSVMDRELEVLCVSQFTLQCILKGNKPDFHSAMPADLSQPFYNSILEQLREAYKPELIKGEGTPADCWFLQKWHFMHLCYSKPVEHKRRRLKKRFQCLCVSIVNVMRKCTFLAELYL